MSAFNHTMCFIAHFYISITPGTDLPFFIEGHNDDGGSVAMHLFGVFDKGFFSLLQADAVDDALALAALQTCLDHCKIRRVDTQRHLHITTKDHTLWVRLRSFVFKCTLFLIKVF